MKKLPLATLLWLLVIQFAVFAADPRPVATLDVAPELSVARAVEKFVITFTGALESASEPQGPWTAVTNGSPLTLSSGQATRFYRARNRHLEPGRPVEKLVLAATGGTVIAADGAELTIPPGALASNTVIRINIPSAQTNGSEIITYHFEPAGLKLAKPAVLKLPYQPVVPGQQPHITIYESSTSNPEVDVGRERTNWRDVDLLARDDTANTLTLQLSHFTFVYAFIAVDNDLYFVTDIPPKYLKPGDILFTLTTYGSKGPTWQPGHVALFTGGAGSPSGIIEADGQSVVKNTVENFRSEGGHLYLGPRRPGRSSNLNRPTASTQAERDAVGAFAEASLGKPYSIIGEGPGGRLATDGFSCVGLVNGAWSYAGKPVMTGLERTAVSTPLEAYWATHPVPDIDVCPGDDITIPVYGVTIDHRSPYLLTTMRGWYSKKESYDITRSDIPLGATFTGNYTTGYTFHWVPTAADAGKQRVCYWEMKATPQETLPTGSLTTLPQTYASRTLFINVKDLSSGPIQAQFKQESFSTTYTVQFSNPDGEEISIQWSGPNCGTWSPEQVHKTRDKSGVTRMVWVHPHPPCDPTTDHSSARITLSIKCARCDKSLVSAYQGASTGEGAPAEWR